MKKVALMFLALGFMLGGTCVAFSQKFVSFADEASYEFSWWWHHSLPTLGVWLWNCLLDTPWLLGSIIELIHCWITGIITLFSEIGSGAHISEFMELSMLYKFLVVGGIVFYGLILAFALKKVGAWMIETLPSWAKAVALYLAIGTVLSLPTFVGAQERGIDNSQVFTWVGIVFGQAGSIFFVTRVIPMISEWWKERNGSVRA